MTEKYESFPEVSLAIAKLRSRLNRMTAVYALTYTAFAIAVAWAWIAVVTLSSDVTNIKGQLTGIGNELASMKATVESIRASLLQPDKRSALEMKPASPSRTP